MDQNKIYKAISLMNDGHTMEQAIYIAEKNKVNKQKATHSRMKMDTSNHHPMGIRTTRFTVRTPHRKDKGIRRSKADIGMTLTELLISGFGYVVLDTLKFLYFKIG